jgi:hypothetical protein
MKEIAMKELSRFKAIELIKSTHGKLFSCEFQKMDGSLRKMLCLIPPPLKDAKRPSPAKPQNAFVLVRDMLEYNRVLKATQDSEKAHKASYRLINLATMLKLTINGTTYTMTD